MGILDTIIHTKQSDSLKTFKPSDIVGEILAVLKERDRQILIQRYGLNGNDIKTLAAIGQEQNLTRERVRQIEKDVLKNLRKSGLNKESFLSTKELLLSTITEHGRIMAQDSLLQKMGVKSEEDRNAIIFLLYLIEELEDYMHSNYKKTWVTILFNKQLLHEFTEESKKILESHNGPLSSKEFLETFKSKKLFQLSPAFEIPMFLEDFSSALKNISSKEELKGSDLLDKINLTAENIDIIIGSLTRESAKKIKNLSELKDCVYCCEILKEEHQKNGINDFFWKESDSPW